MEDPDDKPTPSTHFQTTFFQRILVIVALFLWALGAAPPGWGMRSSDTPVFLGEMSSRASSPSLTAYERGEDSDFSPVMPSSDASVDRSFESMSSLDSENSDLSVRVSDHEDKENVVPSGVALERVVVGGLDRTKSIPYGHRDKIRTLCKPFFITADDKVNKNNREDALSLEYLSKEEAKLRIAIGKQYDTEIKDAKGRKVGPKTSFQPGYIFEVKYKLKEKVWNPIKALVYRGWVKIQACFAIPRGSAPLALTSVIDDSEKEDAQEHMSRLHTFMEGVFGEKVNTSQIVEYCMNICKTLFSNLLTRRFGISTSQDPAERDSQVYLSQKKATHLTPENAAIFFNPFLDKVPNPHKERTKLSFKSGGRTAEFTPNSLGKHPPFVYLTMVCDFETEWLTHDATKRIKPGKDQPYVDKPLRLYTDDYVTENLEYRLNGGPAPKKAMEPTLAPAAEPLYAGPLADPEPADGPALEPVPLEMALPAVVEDQREEVPQVEVAAPVVAPPPVIQVLDMEQYEGRARLQELKDVIVEACRQKQPVKLDNLYTQRAQALLRHLNDAIARKVLEMEQVQQWQVSYTLAAQRSCNCSAELDRFAPGIFVKV